MKKTYWLVFRRDNDTEVFIQPGWSLIDSRMKAMLAGQQGEFKESHLLDARTVKKMPPTVIGRTLTSTQAKKILARM